jgi:hypothetical protein
LLIVLTIWLALSPLNGLAQSTPEAAPAPSFLLEPVGQDGTYLTSTQEPGTTVELEVMLGNAGTADVEARTFVADAFTLVNGGFGVRTDEEPKTGATTWIDYKSETLDLAPGEAMNRKVPISIPEGTPPGQYIAGLVLQTAQPIAVGDSGMLQQIIAKAIAVFITVPGDVTPKFEIGAASIKQTAISNNLQIEIRNTGNVLVKPMGDLEVTAPDGQTVLTAPIEMGSVYAGMTTTLELAIPTVLTPGTYSIDLALSDEATKAEAANPALELIVPEASASATPVVAPVSIAGITLDPISDSASGALQIVNVSVTLTNTGIAIPSARLTLTVMRDGELVENFPLNSSMVVPVGDTVVQQRYLPLTGWASGTYTFSATLETVDANTGQATVIATAEASSTVVVP